MHPTQSSPAQKTRHEIQRRLQLYDGCDSVAPQLQQEEGNLANKNDCAGLANVAIVQTLHLRAHIHACEYKQSYYLRLSTCVALRVTIAAQKTGLSVSFLSYPATLCDHKQRMGN